MATPTEAECITQIKNAIKILEDERTGAATYLTNEDTLVQSLETDYADEVTSGVGSFRANKNGNLSPSVGRAMIDPLLRQWAVIIASPDLAPDGPIEDVIRRIYARLVTSSQTIKERAFSYGTSTDVGTPSGKGSILRCTKNEDNYNLEAMTPEVKVFRCVRDANSGTQAGREVFEVLGKARFRDNLNITGSGVFGEIAAKNADDSIVQNPSFASYDAAASPTSVPGWSPGSGAIGTLIDIDTTNYYRGFGNDATETHQSAKFKVDGILVQTAANMAQQFSPFIPYVAQLAYNRSVNSATGVLTYRVGGVSAAVADLSAASSGWQVLRVALTSSSWYKAIKEQSLTIEIEKSGSGTAGLLIDDVVITPMDLIDGSYYAAMGAGASGSVQVPFLRGDAYTITDTATDSVIQRWLWRLYARAGGLLAPFMMWPPAASPTIADP